MPAIPVGRDERLLRVFLREEVQVDELDSVNPGDFVRFATQPGISMFRLSETFTTADGYEALGRNAKKRLKLMGSSVITAGELLDRGYRFVAPNLTDAHVSVRCIPCDLNEVNRRPWCQPLAAIANECGLYQEPILRELRSIFSVTEVAEKRFHD